MKTMKNVRKRIGVCLLVLSVVMSGTGTIGVKSAKADTETVYYGKYDGEIKPVTDYSVVTENDTVWGIDGGAGSYPETFYVVRRDVTITHPITTQGNVKLILCDGAKLTVTTTTKDVAAITFQRGGLYVYAGNTSRTIAGSGVFDVQSSGDAIKGDVFHLSFFLHFIK